MSLCLLAAILLAGLLGCGDRTPAEKMPEWQRSDPDKQP